MSPEALIVLAAIFAAIAAFFVDGMSDHEDETVRELEKYFATRPNHPMRGNVK